MLKNKIILTITVLLLLVVCNDLFAQDREKNNYVTINCENKPLRAVLHNLSSQTNIKFVYSDELINERRITCNLENVTLEQALRELLKTTNIYFTFVSADTLIVLHKNTDVVSQKINSKITIRGKIIDKSSKLSLGFVNVFLANTTLGDAADESGIYIIPNVPIGSYELIASMMGYEIQKKVVRIYDSKDKIVNFELTAKVLPGEKVTVTAKHAKEWKKNLKIFKQKFFGQKEFAKKCELINPEVLDFRYDKKSGQFKAIAEAELKFENNALGYEVTVFLEEFYAELSNNDGRAGITQAPEKGAFRCISTNYFKELSPKNEKQKKRWDKNRLIAYNGSQCHFFTSLINGSFKKEGFKFCGAKNVSNMTRYDYTLNIKELLKISENGYHYILSFPDLLKVIYTKEQDEIEFDAGMQRIARMPRGWDNAEANLRLRCLVQTSWIKIAAGKDIIFDINGIIIRNGAGVVVAFGYWHWNRITESLPYDYQPEEKTK